MKGPGFAYGFERIQNLMDNIQNRDRSVRIARRLSSGFLSAAAEADRSQPFSDKISPLHAMISRRSRAGSTPISLSSSSLPRISNLSRIQQQLHPIPVIESLNTGGDDLEYRRRLKMRGLGFGVGGIDPAVI